MYIKYYNKVVETESFTNISFFKGKKKVVDYFVFLAES